MQTTKLSTALHFQVVALLERYENHATQLVERWLDPELYRRVSGEIEELVQRAAALPGLAASALALRIAHSELLGALWQDRAGRAGCHPAPATLVQRHGDCVHALRSACVRALQAG
ncbi:MULTISPECIES: hypothetical protein [Ramlibacter]|uniref:Uncharacterized protein n=1 Tax=Ramlibacter aquaticus TaxID=2780094 RepID=A0ABR9SE41_9BURK|nr:MULTISPECIES: hypothetical protein [Ramlibacter]MBE7940620.1 hypothetical protein [Ramlibacter aquaticus]